jgi:hypothetical protein
MHVPPTCCREHTLSERKACMHRCMHDAS